jgi:hypothetical protein
MLVGAPFLIAIAALSLGAANYAVLCAHRSEEITVRASYAYAFKHFWRFVWLLFLQAVMAWVLPSLVIGTVMAVLLGVGAVLAKSAGSQAMGAVIVLLVLLMYILIIVTCVWMWLRYSLAFPASVAEDRPAWPSLKRSVGLSKGSRGRIFVMFLLVWVITMAVSLVFTVPIDVTLAFFFRKSLVPGQAPATLAIAIQVINLGVDFVVRTLVTPVYATALMLFYFDQRTRQEGYDIELLMAQAGWGDLPPAPEPESSLPAPLIPEAQSVEAASAEGFSPAPPIPAPPAPETPGENPSNPEVAGA